MDLSANMVEFALERANEFNDLRVSEIMTLTVFSCSHVLFTKLVVLDTEGDACSWTSVCAMNIRLINVPVGTIAFDEDVVHF
jgi:hypothetical protein